MFNSEILDTKIKLSSGIIKKINQKSIKIKKDLPKKYKKFIRSEKISKFVWFKQSANALITVRERYN